MKLNPTIAPFEKARKRKAEIEAFMKQFEPKCIQEYDDHGNTVHVYESRWCMGSK